MNVYIRFLYALLVAGTVVLFVGVGLNSLYQPPKNPDYSYSSDTSESSYEKQRDNYQKKEKSYYRNLALLLVIFSLAIMMAGIYLLQRSSVIGEGLALGAVGTGVYAIIATALADSRPLRFVAALLLLLEVLALAQVRFSTGTVVADRPGRPTIHLPPFN